MSSAFPTRPSMLPAASAAALPQPAGMNPGAPAGGGGGGGFDVADIIRVLKQRKLLIAVTFGLAYAMVVAGTLVAYVKFPGYRAVAVVEYRPPREDAFSVFQRLHDPKRMEVPAQTEARNFKSLGLLQEVLKLPEVKNTRFYQSYHGDFQECLYDLRDMVGAGVIRDTTLINVSLSTSNPDESRLIVNSIVERHLNQSRTSEADRMKAEVKRMEETQTRIAGDLREKREEIRRFRERTDVPALEAQRELSTQALAELRTQLNLVAAEAAGYQTQLDAVAGREPWELPVTPEIQLRVEADPLVRFRREQKEAVDIEMQALLRSGQVGENHPQIKLLEARRQGYQEAEVARREQLYDDYLTQQVDGLEQDLAQVNSMRAQLLEQYQEEEAKQRDLDANIQRYQEMVADADRTEQQLAQIEQRIGEARHAAGDAESVRRLELRQRAEVPPTPTWPSLPLFLGAGFVLAMGAGVGLAFLLEFMDTAVRTPIDVVRSAHLSVLGSIPELDDEEADVDEIETATRVAPTSLISESFRQIRTNLLFSGPEESQKTLLISSPGAGDGKSSIAVNLAITLARGGQRVLLVDANFRRPFVRNAFENTRPEGLSNVLIQQARFEDVVTATDIPNLDVMTAGPLPPTPAELLGSVQLRDMLATAAQQYDRVLFDGPPVLLVSDALVLARQVAGVVVVTRANANSKGALRRANEQLQRIGARVIGAVVNGIKARAGGYFRRQYREFYDYVSDETAPSGLPAPTAPTAAADDEIVFNGDDDEPRDKS